MVGRFICSGSFPATASKACGRFTAGGSLSHVSEPRVSVSAVMFSVSKVVSKVPLSVASGTRHTGASTAPALSAGRPPSSSASMSARVFSM